MKLLEDMVLQTLVIGRPACDLARGVQGAKCLITAALPLRHWQMF